MTTESHIQKFGLIGEIFTFSSKTEFEDRKTCIFLHLSVELIEFVWWFTSSKELLLYAYVKLTNQIARMAVLILPNLRTEHGISKNSRSKHQGNSKIRPEK